MTLAMKSDWVKVNNPNTEKSRNIVVIFTDASAYPLEKSADGVSKYYPADMLKSYDELYDAWNKEMKCRAKRLIIFAPEDAYPWSDMAEEFDEYLFYRP